MNRSRLKIDLVRDEGDRRYPYKDTSAQRLLTIGVGRNLEAKPLSDAVVRLMLDEDIDEATAFLDRELPWWSDLDEVRQRALANMAFNLGGRLLGFKKFLAALEARDFETAAREMQDSAWWGQVGARAVRLQGMIRRGV